MAAGETGEVNFPLDNSLEFFGIFEHNGGMLKILPFPKQNKLNVVLTFKIDFNSYDFRS